MADSYSTLVSRILKNDVLSDAANQMIELNSEPASIKLITTDWKKQLENNISFQDSRFTGELKSSDSIGYSYQDSPQPLLNLTIVGKCRFAKPYEGKMVQIPYVLLKLQDSHPLINIAEKLLKDLGPDVNISEEFKFSFHNCSYFTCADCNSAHSFFKEKGYHLKKLNQPCICVTRIFDGKNILNRFYSQIEEAFSHDFIAIMHVGIQSRYSYTDLSDSNRKKFRIGGKITNFLAFNEAKLDFKNSMHINLGDLTQSVVPIEKPSASLKKQSSENEKPIKEEIDQEINQYFSGNNSTNLKEEFPDVTNLEFVEQDELLDNKTQEDSYSIEDNISIIERVRNKKKEKDDIFSSNENDYRDAKKPRVEEGTFSMDELINNM